MSSACTAENAADEGDTVRVTAHFKGVNKSGVELDATGEHVWGGARRQGREVREHARPPGLGGSLELSLLPLGRETRGPVPLLDASHRNQDALEAAGLSQYAMSREDVGDRARGLRARRAALASGGPTS